MLVSRKPAKMGRPRKPGGRDVLIAGRLPVPIAMALDLYADRTGLTRSQAVRRLIESGLRATLRRRPELF